ncbi:mitochondrial carrier domain-containing protein [Spinellus fusiger]|nr:mitochondrial carrier domain-containing protein [Spinellus fusiger]
MGFTAYYIFASSVASIVARTVTYPIDTIKTRLQAGRIKHMLVNNSLPSLYNGLCVTLFFSVPALSVYLACYAITKDWLDTFPSPWLHHDRAFNPLASGMIAEVVAGIFFTPMEVLKSCLQTDQTHLEQTTYGLIVQIVQTYGYKGLYRGYWMSLVVFVPHTMVYFLVYEQLKAAAGEMSFIVYLVCSAWAGTVATIVSTPLDIVKTRWQVSVSEDVLGSHRGPMGIAYQMWRDEGQWRGFTRGCLARIITMIPMTTISMTVFECLMDLYNTTE